MKKPRIRALLIFLCMLAAGICYSCDRSTDPGMSQEILLETTENTEETEPETAAPCYVHICGEVKNPGVYEAEKGSRIFQAIELAGGFTEEAAAQYLNMAEEIRDGMKIEVPSFADVESGMAGDLAGASKKVNLNSADEAQLMTLTGIGAARAKDIIRYREEHGPFQTIEDIMKVSGIKDAAFQKIKEDITV